jgi:preprotein translocase subunit SecF
MDLALVQLVGVIVGTYSSIFFATPLLVTLRERTQLVRDHNRRVLKRRQPGGRSAAAVTATEPETGDDEPEKVSAGAAAPTRSALADKPAPGAKPTRPTSRPSRPTGKRTPRGR